MELSLSVASAACSAGVAVPPWYKYEEGTQFPGPVTIDAIARALSVDTQELFADLIINKEGGN